MKAPLGQAARSRTSTVREPATTAPFEEILFCPCGCGEHHWTCACPECEVASVRECAGNTAEQFDRRGDSRYREAFRIALDLVRHERDLRDARGCDRDPLAVKYADALAVQMKRTSDESLLAGIGVIVDRESSSGDGNADESVTGSRRVSQAKQIIDTLGDVEFFHDEQRRGYASFDVNGHLETHPIKSSRFRLFCRRQYYGCHARVPSRTALQEAIDQCEASAHFDGAKNTVALRVADIDGTIYLDLCNDAWEVVEIAANGWKVKPASALPLRFWRPQHALSLPIPVQGSRLASFRSLFNTDDRGWALIQSAMLGALRPSFPQPLLALYGPQGSGKSFIASAIRSTIDANASPLRAEPHDDRDLAAIVRNNYVVALDNVSRIPSWLSDSLCRVASGAGFAARELYTDSDEALVVARRPIILTAIEEVIIRGDLADRALHARLRAIPENYETEERLTALFEEAKPRLLGALLDAAVLALRKLPAIRDQRLRLPRMADFAQWAVAAEDALDLPDGAKFLELYADERAIASAAVVESDVISDALRCLLEANGGSWDGYAAELLRALADGDEELKRNREWPRSTRALTGRLERLIPDLAQVGITVTFGQRDRKRRRSIAITMRDETRKAPGGTSATSAISANGSKRSEKYASPRADVCEGNEPTSATGTAVNRYFADVADDADVEPDAFPSEWGG